MKKSINKILEKFFHKKISSDNLSVEDILQLLEDKTKEKMNNDRMAWLVNHWHKPFWSFFKKESQMPPRYVSKKEADAAIVRLKRFASVAQSGERQPVKLDVVGSKPT